MIYYDKDGIMVRSSIEQDIGRMKNSLRESDIQEVYAAANLTPEQALRFSYESSSMCLTVEKNKEPIAMFGISPATLISNTGSIWLLSTDGIKSIRKSFIKKSRWFINIMLSQFPLLENYVDARNKLSIRWLKWCGAKIQEPRPYGPENRPFSYFSFGGTI